jgi:hypothetical protein
MQGEPAQINTLLAQHPRSFQNRAMSDGTYYFNVFTTPSMSVGSADVTLYEILAVDSPAAARLATSDFVTLSVLRLRGSYGSVTSLLCLSRSLYCPPCSLRAFNAFLKASSSGTSASLKCRVNFCSVKAYLAGQLISVTTAITANTTNANVPDRVFIMTAGLTPRAAIIKPKVKGAAGTHRGREVGNRSDAAARPVRA